MNFSEFKNLVLEKAKEFNLTKEHLIRLRTELFHAKVYYDDIGDLYEDLHTKPIKTEACLIPLLFGLTKKCNLNENIELIQTRPGSSGGI